MNNIYRKSSLDKLSSPEQLDKMIHITKTSGWIALLGMFLMVLAAGYWAFFGEISEKVPAEGICMKLETGVEKVKVIKESEALHVYCYVPLSIAKKIQVGMKANILPLMVNEQETGYLLGKVIRVDSYAVSKDEIYSKLGDDILVRTFRDENKATEPVIEIEIMLYKDDSTRSGYIWSNQNGRDVIISDFTMVEVYIITSTMTPFKKFTRFL